MQQSHSNGPNNSTSSSVASHSNTQKANNQLPKPAKRHKSNNEAASNTITYNPILTDPSTGLPVTNLNNQQFIQVQLPPTVGQQPQFIQLVPSPLNKMDQTNSIQVQKHTSFVTNLPQGSPLKIGNSSTPVLLSPIRTISTIAQSTPPLKFISNTKRNIIPLVSPRKPIDAAQGSSPQNSVLSTRKVQTVLTSINPSFLLANPNIKIQPAQPKPMPNKIKIKNPGSITGQAMQSTSQLQPPFLMPKTSTAPQTQFPMFVPISLAGNMFNSSNNQTNNTLRIHQQFQSASTTKKPANVVTINPSNHSFLIPVQLQQKPANQQQKQQPQYFVHKVNNIQPAVPSSPKPSKARSNNASSSEMKPLKKPCNCTKSQCLKLYCECFANGEFCTNCNCRSCLNNIAHEAERSKAIKACLERNPYAFHPKIGKGRVKGDTERRHTKGCNCKRSGCLKNYCECYEAKILCSSLCKCVGCKNYEESADRKTLMHLADAAEVRVLQQNAARSKLDSEMKSLQKHNPFVKDRSRVSFMTPDVAKMTRDIMLARVQDAESVNQEESEIERSVLEEFNRCLNQIIDKSNLSANKNKR